MLNSSLKSGFAGIASSEEFHFGYHFPRRRKQFFGAGGLPELAVKRAIVLTPSNQSFVEKACLHFFRYYIGSDGGMEEQFLLAEHTGKRRGFGNYECRAGRAGDTAEHGERGAVVRGDGGDVASGGAVGVPAG
jgi:hypothetical protein